VRAARLLPILFLVWGSAARGQEVAPPQLAPWLDTANDQIVERAYVPSAENKVGEVRILRRGRATVVETLLYTKVLSRVVGEIRKKELANWPGNSDAARYVEALERVQKQIWSRLPTNQRVSDRRQKLWIDFVVAPGIAFVGLGAFEMKESHAEVRVVSRELLALLEPSPEYVRRNLRLITSDAFHIADTAVDPLLGPLP
jgi:hypothetical protein